MSEFQPSERDYTLGFVIDQPQLLDAVEVPRDFFYTAHQREVWAAVCDLRKRGEPICTATVAGLSSVNDVVSYISAITTGLIRLKPEDFRRRLLRQMAEDAKRRMQSLAAKDNSDLDELAAFIEDARRLEQEAEDLASEAALPAGCLRTGTELQALELEKDEIIDKVFHARSISVLAGPGGAGKSTFMFGAGKAISRGDEFLDLRTVKTPVVFVDYENPLGLLIERTRKLDVQDPFFWHLSAETPPPKLDSPQWEMFKRLPAGAILVFDTLRAAHDGDENSSQDMGLVMGRLKLLRELGFTIVLIHHSPKGNERIYKGSTAISDLSDHVLRLYRCRGNTLEEAPDQDEPDGNSTFVLCTGKTRYEPFHLYLSFNPEAGLFTRAEDPKAELIDQLAEYIAGDGLGKNQSAIVAWAKDALGVKKRDSILALLKRGEGSRWKTVRGFQNARIYEPL